ncbi:MAG: hypothetical protein WCF84_09385 [Anaerolineae bacterium]
MRRGNLVALLLAFAVALLGCTSTPQVVKETVIVGVTPTPAPTNPPAMDTPAPSDTAIIPSVTPVTPPPTNTPQSPTATLTPPVVQIALIDPGGMTVLQTAPNSNDPLVTTALVFDVDVSIDTTKIKDAVANVDMRVLDAQNRTVYQHTEMTARYCLFGGDQICNVWEFGKQSNAWPNNAPVQRGAYFLRALATATSGRTRAAEAAIYIDPRPNGQDSPVQVQIVQTNPGNDDQSVDKAIVFQAEAFDTRVGNQDGNGIDHVDFLIVDQLGNVVHQHTEKVAKYCAFSGGEPDCIVWDFTQNGNRWDTGIPVYNKTQYFLRAVAYSSKDGTTGSADTEILIGK